ncbi:hypothetical protein [Agriterribacter sp.]|uniref:hypothetical protein n=1 Tax=Agriterribacter sp. TaxID=2821509 RepID=UPI002BCB4AE8|nr:hypothetical protein [Agriterribacter sp.]HTN06378.1 hypothetical protein [Agriterribacter sp.]
MKRKSETDRKAGNRPKEKSQTFKNVFSKSASMLLVTIMGLSAMSFVQDDSFVNGRDTNQSAAKVKHMAAPNNETCCVTTVASPGDGVNTAYFISTPGKKAMYKADNETIVAFISDVKERRIWNMNRVNASAKADKEMYFNFMLGAIYPSNIVAAEADKEMSSNFVDDIVHVVAFTANAAARADEEVAGNFIAANLPVTIAKPTVEQMVKADAAVIAAFENANHPVISVPSATAAQKADQEVMQNYILPVKLTVSK